MAEAEATLKANFENFGYGYLPSPEAAVPPVGLTFYSFHIMVALGGYLLAFFALVIFACHCRGGRMASKTWFAVVAIASIPLVWICSQAGWVTAEVGRQPWTIQNLLPVNAAISDIPASSVQLTFWIFAALFTLMLAAEACIMLRYISHASKGDITR